MSDVGREEDMTKWVLHQRIYIVGVLVDMIEAKYPWSTESRENLIWFQQRTGRDREFLNMWHDELGNLLEQQKIKLHELMSAEMLNERSRHENRVKIAEIMRKSEAEITAEDMKTIEARIASREIPSSSSSRPNLGKGTEVEDDANKGPQKAAPAVVKKISKAPPAQPPNRDIPPMPRSQPRLLTHRPSGRRGHPRGRPNGLPLVRRGHPRGRQNGLPLVLGPAKEKEIGVEKASPRADLPIGIVPLNDRTLNTCLPLLPSTELRRMDRSMGKEDSRFKRRITRISESLIGGGANARLIRPTTRILNGMMLLGLVILLLLLRMTAITGEVWTIARNLAVAAADGTHLSILHRIWMVGVAQGLLREGIRIIGVPGSTTMVIWNGKSLTMTGGIARISDTRTD